MRRVRRHRRVPGDAGADGGGGGQRRRPRGGLCLLVVRRGGAVPEVHKPQEAARDAQGQVRVCVWGGGAAARGAEPWLALAAPRGPELQMAGRGSGSRPVFTVHAASYHRVIGVAPACGLIVASPSPAHAAACRTTCRTCARRPLPPAPQVRRVGAHIPAAAQGGGAGRAPRPRPRRPREPRHELIRFSAWACAAGPGRPIGLLGAALGCGCWRGSAAAPGRGCAWRMDQACWDGNRVTMPWPACAASYQARPLLLRRRPLGARRAWDLGPEQVWVEFYSTHLGRWVHVDPCEAAFDTVRRRSVWRCAPSCWASHIRTQFALCLQRASPAGAGAGAEPGDAARAGPRGAKPALERLGWPARPALGMAAVSRPCSAVGCCP